VTVLVALGMHRPPLPEELAQKLGPLGRRLRAEVSLGAEPAAFATMGPVRIEGLPPVPVTVHRRAAACDLLVATGWVEPHQYAGFSGGGKTVAVGCASEATISVLHGLAFVDHPGTRLARLAGNPFQAVIGEAAARARLAFVLNLAETGGGLRAAAGPPVEVLTHLATGGGWDCPVGSAPFDVVFAGLDPTKARNLYQASRALTYLALADRPVLRPGGWIVVVARCEEGFGRGPGEAAFRDGLRSGDTPAAVRARLRETGLSAGGQRAYLVARALESYGGLLVGAEQPQALAGSLFQVVPDLGTALAFLERELGGSARALIVPDALNQLPVPGGG
jgi:nickel-dependent lactate racemase